jgi:multidrug transporter EmrE-like cation transporter
MNILLTIPGWIWLLVSVLFFAAGEYFSKKWVLGPNTLLFLLVIIFYVAGSISWLPALMQRNQLAVLGTLWLLLGMIATVSIGLFLFGEKLSAVKVVGLGLALVSLVLLNI